MRIYRNSESGQGFEDLGEFDEGLFWKLVAGLPLFEEKEVSIGLYRSKRDYLDVSRDQDSSYRLYSERMFPDQPWWKRLFSSHIICREDQRIDFLREAVSVYIHESRASFESRYA